MRTQIKKFRQAVTAGDRELAAGELKIAISLVDRTRTKGVIHKNTAARTVSRLQSAFNRMEDQKVA
jgi:small subunit ribosomal protein S20